MFGVVPRPLWEVQAAPDAQNRIAMACNCLLIRKQGELTLIDTGIGDRFTARERELFAIDPDIHVLSSLQMEGIRPEQITQVVITHLHFDHVGGALSRTDQGLKATFPQAIHIIQQGEWEDALQGRSIMRSSYRPEDLQALETSGRIRFVGGDTDLGSGISTFVTGGHTENHQGITIRTESQTIAYPADLLPTRNHLRPYWNMAYDMFPYQTLRRKQEFLQQACEQEWIIAWNHDPQKLWSRLHLDDAHYIAEDLESC